MQKKGKRMKKILALFMVGFIFCLMANAKDKNFKGSSSVEILSNGAKLLILKGTHEERGYAHGFLLAEDIMNLYKGYFIKTICKNKYKKYKKYKKYFNDKFQVASAYTAEAKGIISGMKEAGVDMICTIHKGPMGMFTKKFELSYIDILMGTAIAEFVKLDKMKLGCSSATRSSTPTSSPEDFENRLGGVTIRLLDWPPSKALLDSHVMIVNIPAETDEQPWISWTFSGFIGCLSGVNNEGVAVFYNEEFISESPSNLAKNKKFTPIHLITRSAIESDKCTRIKYVESEIQNESRGIKSIIMAVGKGANDSEEECVVIESDGTNYETRHTPKTPWKERSWLVATNHFRKVANVPKDKRKIDRFNSLTWNLNRNHPRKDNEEYFKDDIEILTRGPLETMLASAGSESDTVQVLMYLPNRGLMLWKVKTDLKQSIAGLRNKEEIYLYDNTVVFELDSLMDGQLTPTTISSERFNLDANVKAKGSAEIAKTVLKERLDIEKGKVDAHTYGVAAHTAATQGNELELSSSKSCKALTERMVHAAEKDLRSEYLSQKLWDNDIGGYQKQQPQTTHNRL